MADNEQSIEDEWASALSEQASASSPEPEPASEKLFQNLSEAQPIGAANNDIDMVLDIPVLLTVELGRTKIAIKNITKTKNKSSFLFLSTFSGIFLFLVSQNTNNHSLVVKS